MSTTTERDRGSAQGFSLRELLSDIASDGGCGNEACGEGFASLLHTPPNVVRELFTETKSDGSPYAAYGVKSAQGVSKVMEDSFSVKEKLSPQPDSNLSAPCSALESASEILIPGFSEDLAFFSVYDGHGGDEVAQHCSDRLHQLFTERLTASASAAAAAAASSSSSMISSQPSCTLQLQQSSQPSCTLEPQQSSSATDPPDCVPDSATTLTATATTDLESVPTCPKQLVSHALRSSFHATDEELAGTEAGEYVGATAVVAVIGSKHIWVAHCGDSRAVIQRGGDAVAITSDHKPDREDEAARIRAAGGRIVYNGGANRVMGMLAMTRALGDHYLRPFVIAEPEIACLERQPDDEVLIIATDGLWDVFSSLEATTLATRCIMRSKERGMSKHGACRVAASVLAKAAMQRGSRDNITVIVVDVSNPVVEGASGSGGADDSDEAAAAGGELAPRAGPSGTEPKSGRAVGAVGAVGAAALPSGVEEQQGQGQEQEEQLRGPTSPRGACMGEGRRSGSMGKFFLLKSQTNVRVRLSLESARPVCSETDLQSLDSQGIRRSDGMPGSQDCSSPGEFVLGGAGWVSPGGASPQLCPLMAGLAACSGQLLEMTSQGEATGSGDGGRGAGGGGVGVGGAGPRQGDAEAGEGEGAAEARQAAEATDGVALEAGGAQAEPSNSLTVDASGAAAASAAAEPGGPGGESGSSDAVAACVLGLSVALAAPTGQPSAVPMPDGGGGRAGVNDPPCKGGTAGVKEEQEEEGGPCPLHHRSVDGPQLPRHSSLCQVQETLSCP